MGENKMHLICNKLTFLEMFIKQMITRESKMDKEQYKSYLKTAFELIIEPQIQKIKEDGQRMEDGLHRRQIFLVEHELEEDYQKFKKNNK